jgi:hypothetical protein
MIEQSDYGTRGGEPRRSLSIIALGLIGVALATILGVYESIPVKQHLAAAATTAAPDDATTQAIRDLQTSQQQSIDQLKALQQIVSSDQTEMKRLSEEVAGLARKLEALQKSFASAQQAPIVEPAEPAKLTQTPDNSDPPLSPSYGARRVAGAAPVRGLSGAALSGPTRGSPAAIRRRAPKESPLAGRINDLLNRQNTGDQFTLRSSVDLVQVQLRHRLQGELPYAIVKRTLSGQVGNGAARRFI